MSDATYTSPLQHVTDETLGAGLVADAAVAATTLAVDWAVYFSEDGGLLRVGDVEYTYDSVDKEANTIHLTTGLTVAAVADDRVDAMNAPGSQAHAWVAYVDGPDPDGEPIPAIIPTPMVGYFQDAEEGDLVHYVEDGPDAYRVVSRPNTEPVMDASVIDPTTLPEFPAPTEAPAESPTITVTGDSGGVTIVATGDVAPSTTLDYYFNGTLAQSTTSKVARLSAADYGMIEGTDYPFYVIARNDVGSADPSPTVAGRLNMGVSQQTVLGWVAAGFLLAGEIEVGNISIRPATSIDPGGIEIQLSSGGQIWFPADGSDAIITARLFAQELEVQGNMRILGEDNDLLGGLYIAATVSPPAVAPDVATTLTDPLARTPLPAVLQTSGYAAYIRNPTLVSGVWWVLYQGATNPIRSYDAAGAELSRLTPPSVTGSVVMGMTKLGSTWYVLSQGSRSIYNYVDIYDSTFTTRTGGFTLASDILYPTQGAYETIDNDGTNLILGAQYSPESSTRQFRMAVVSTAGVRAYWIKVSDLPDACFVSALWRGTADFGATRLIATYYLASYSTNWAYSHTTTNGSTATRQSANDWARTDAGIYAYWGGLFWDGTRFHAAGQDKIVHHGSNTSAPSRDFDYGWYKTGTGEETPTGPPKNFTAPKRSWTKVTVGTPSPPANAARVYIDNNRQADLGAGVTSVVYDSAFDLSGADSPLTNAGFEAIASPGFIASKALASSGTRNGEPRTELKGDGETFLGDFHMLSSGVRHRAKLTYAGPSGAVASSPTPASMGFNGTEFETVSTFGDLANNRLVIPEDGRYFLEIFFIWNDTGSTGSFDAFLDVNGTQIKYDRKGSNGSSVVSLSIITMMQLAQGDLITGRRAQTSGGNRTVASAYMQALAL